MAGLIYQGFADMVVPRMALIRTMQEQLSDVSMSLQGSIYSGPEN